MSQVIKTDEFKEYGSEIKNYCPSCFLSKVKTGFGNYDIGNCSICNSELVLKYDDEETVALAREDYTVHYICKKVKDALVSNFKELIAILEDEDHDELIIYSIQPNSEK